MSESGGKSRYLILGMLAHAPLTGYNIRKWIEHEYSHFWQASFGQIYPILKTLVREGQATCSGNSEDSNGRGQIVYSITDAGRQALKEWLREEPNVEKLRYEILLKISFGSQTELPVLLHHLDEFIKRNEAELREMYGYIERFDQLRLRPEEDHTFGRLTALCGVYLYSAMRDWALEAKEILKKKEVNSQ